MSTQIKVQLQRKTNTTCTFWNVTTLYRKRETFPLFVFFLVFQVLSITAVSKVTRHLISGEENFCTICGLDATTTNTCMMIHVLNLPYPIFGEDTRLF